MYSLESSQSNSTSNSVSTVLLIYTKILLARLRYITVPKETLNFFNIPPYKIIDDVICSIRPVLGNSLSLYCLY